MSENERMEDIIIVAGAYRCKNWVISGGYVFVMPPDMFIMEMGVEGDDERNATNKFIKW